MKLSRIAKIYLISLCSFAAVALVYHISTISWPDIYGVSLFGLFFVLAFLAEIYATRFPTQEQGLSSSVAIYLAALFILGPSFAVLLVFLISITSGVVFFYSELKENRRSFTYIIGFNTSQLVLAISFAGFILTAFAHPTLLPDQLREIGIALLAFGGYIFLNTGLVSGIIGLTTQKRFFSTWKTNIREFSLQYVVLFILALLLVILYGISFWHTFLGILPLAVVHSAFYSSMRLQTESRTVLEKISQLLDHRDNYTAAHSATVEELAGAIARELKLPKKEIEEIEIAARVHDIGKIGIPDAILLKPGKLTPKEWEVIKRHPVIGADIIQELAIYAPIVDLVRYEHERWDGSGYPRGLKGEEIPRGARVIAAADIYNALTTDRPYRPAYTPQAATDLIKEMRGKDLDPEVADALLRVIKAQDLYDGHSIGIFK